MSAIMMTGVVTGSSSRNIAASCGGHKIVGLGRPGPKGLDCKPFPSSTYLNTEDLVGQKGCWDACRKGAVESASDDTIANDWAGG